MERVSNLVIGGECDGLVWSSWGHNGKPIDSSVYLEGLPSIEQSTEWSIDEPKPREQMPANYFLESCRQEGLILWFWTDNQSISKLDDWTLNMIYRRLLVHHRKNKANHSQPHGMSLQEQARVQSGLAPATESNAQKQREGLLR